MSGRGGNGGHVADVRTERVHLDDGVPMMWLDRGPVVRMAYDPRQIEEAAALAMLCIHLPRLLAEGLTVLH